MITAKDLACAMHDHAEAYEKEAAQIDVTAKAMVKPGERRTRQELEGKSRNLSQIVYHLRHSVRAMKAAGLL